MEREDPTKSSGILIPPSEVVREPGPFRGQRRLVRMLYDVVLHGLADDQHERPGRTTCYLIHGPIGDGDLRAMYADFEGQPPTKAEVRFLRRIGGAILQEREQPSRTITGRFYKTTRILEAAWKDLHSQDGRRPGPTQSNRPSGTKKLVTTPGPWNAELDQDGTTFVVRDAFETLVCRVEPGPRASGNAQAIAAVPLLVAALVAAMNDRLEPATRRLVDHALTAMLRNT